MITMSLPPTVTQIMPLLKQLNADQKLMIVKELLFETENNEVSLSETKDNLAWEMGKDVFGSYHSGRTDLSQNAKAIVKDKIRAKHG